VAISIYPLAIQAGSISAEQVIGAIRHARLNHSRMFIANVVVHALNLAYQDPALRDCLLWPIRGDAGRSSPGI
jgi:hypothetical protein